jgi:RsiW-degrading membrane proteinase PrsW (M82 family)
MEIIVGILACAFIALLPTTMCSLLVWWADRYERESWWLMIVAFLWGSLPAIAFASIVQAVASVVHILWSPSEASFWLLAVWAPLTEEIFKGLAVWGLFVFYRTQFDGVLDGLIYGLLVGFGFSMTEDFIYYSAALLHGGVIDMAVLAVVRGILFATNHSVYTGLVGLGFGLSTLSKTNLERVGWPLLGLMAAIAFHSIHNIGSLVGSAPESPSWLRLSAFLWTALMAISWMLVIVVIVRLAWYHQVRIIRQELSSEVGKILTSQELEGICQRWSFPVYPTAHIATRRRRLVQMALRRHRLRLAGASRELELKRLMELEYQYLSNQFESSQLVSAISTLTHSKSCDKPSERVF